MINKQISRKMALQGKIVMVLSLLCKMTVGHILRLSCKEHGNFSFVKENAILQGSVLATFTDVSSVDCEQKCLLHNRCKSINVEKDSKTCELNENSTIVLTNGEKDLVSKSNWMYKSTDYNETLVGENCQILNPCKLGAVCMDTCTCPGYDCIPGLKDCQAARKAGYRANGVYKVFYNGFPKQWLTVFCDMTTDEGGWIVFQRRIDNSVEFYRNWSEYQQGFGVITGNYWLGLDKLHLLAAPGRGAVLRVDIKHRDDANKVYAYYSKFEIGNEAARYRLKIGGYVGNAGDSLAYHNNMKFSTYDQDNDEASSSCAPYNKGAWWYNKCSHCNLNGVYPTTTPSNNVIYMSWYGLKNSYGNIIFSEMKLRFFH